MEEVDLDRNKNPCSNGIDNGGDISDDEPNENVDATSEFKPDSDHCSGGPVGAEQEFEPEAAAFNDENVEIPDEVLHVNPSSSNNQEKSEEDLLKSSVDKLKLVEVENLRLVDENEDQRKVIEMLRREITKKEEDARSRELEMKSALLEYSEKEKAADKRIADLQKSFANANRDKESMVIKYAMGEKDLIVARRGMEELEKRLKESSKDKESLQYKIKTLSTERTRLQGICEARANETNAAKKESDKWKEEFRATEQKLLLSNSRLNSEVEAHKETNESLDRTFKQLSELQGSIDSLRSECEKEREQQKAEGELLKRKEKEILKEKEVKNIIDSTALGELEELRKKHEALIVENNELSVKVQASEKELLSLETCFSEAKETVTRQKTEIVDLFAKCAEMESLRLQLEKEKERLVMRDSEVARLRAEAQEGTMDMASCRRKEAELLQFTEKLTEKNVTLQSEFSSVEVKVKRLEEERKEMCGAVSRCESELSRVTLELEEEASARREETELLARKLAEKTRQAEASSQLVQDIRDEMEVMKRKSAQRLKEMSKELVNARKRLEQEQELPHAESSSSLSPVSRCSSASSINRIGESEGEASDQNTYYKEKVPVDSDTQQLLVEKIVKLQKACARRQEKIDFLEEHGETMLTEIKKKNKLIQAYFMNLESGALISEESELHKAVVGATGSGIMASLYNSKAPDSGITLELSLEINRKLQTVLEDTLLKNITLKENINTLGEELSRISMERQRLK